MKSFFVYIRKGQDTGHVHCYANNEQEARAKAVAALADPSVEVTGVEQKDVPVNVSWID